MTTEAQRAAAPRGRALVTFARSWQALAAIRSLGRRGIEVVAGDEIALTPGGLSKYSIDSFRYPSPEADPNGFLAAIEDAVERFAPDDDIPYVLMPVHRETYIIARHRDRFEPRVSMALPSSRLIEQVRDKGRLVELARELGVTTPRTWMPSSREDLDTMAPEVDYPAFVKVRSGVAGVGVEKVDDEDQLRRVYADLLGELPAGARPPIIQQAAPGSDYCVSALLDRGETRAVLTYRNLRSVIEGAPGAMRQTVEAPVPEAATAKLLEGLDWHGIAEVDFMWTGEADDPAYLIEINPRFFGGLFQAIVSGVDYPWMLFRLACGESVEGPDEVDLETITETPVTGLLATLREAVESGSRWGAVEAAWEEAKAQFTDGAVGDGLQSLWRGLKDGLDPEHRAALIERLLAEREDSVSQLLADDDPRAILGLLYPLAIFLRRGSITPGMIVGAEPVDKGDASG